MQYGFNTWPSGCQLRPNLSLNRTHCGMRQKASYFILGLLPHRAAKSDTELPKDTLGLRNYVSTSRTLSDRHLGTTRPAAKVSNSVCSG